MEQRRSRHQTLACAQCGRAAAEISLLPAGEPTTPDANQRHRLERTDFVGAVTVFGQYEALAGLFDAIRQADFRAARHLDPDFVAFHCAVCDRVYCDTCWQMGPRVFDAGFYDYTSGTCPRGHEQIVDD